jgi:hypothetical protein
VGHYAVMPSIFLDVDVARLQMDGKLMTWRYHGYADTFYLELWQDAALCQPSGMAFLYDHHRRWFQESRDSHQEVLHSCPT